MLVLTTLAYPAVLLRLCAGAGLLVDSCSGRWLPASLLPAVGASALMPSRARLPARPGRQLAGHAAFTSYMAHAIFLTPSALAVRTPREVRSSACAPCGGSHAWRELLSGA